MLIILRLELATHISRLTILVPFLFDYKVSWDNEIKRALVIIRNPMGAIPSFFNHIYEIKNHLPIHSERAPVEAWIEWRDKFAENQVM